MAKSNNSFIKKLKADKKAKKRKEKLNQKLEKKNNPTSGKLEDMMAYVDEFGNISDAPPEPKKPEPRKAGQKKPELYKPEPNKGDQKDTGRSKEK